MTKERPLIVAVSGYFDPVHEGHIDYFKRAKALARELGGPEAQLVVIINNERQSWLKYPERGPFIPLATRVAVLKELKPVDDVFVSIDEDSSVCKSLNILRPDVFAKGGDRFSSEIPEAETCRKLGIKLIDSIGEKLNSSSKIIEGLKGKTNNQ